jgi:hypothetical protein
MKKLRLKNFCPIKIKKSGQDWWGVICPYLYTLLFYKKQTKEFPEVIGPTSLTWLKMCQGDESPHKFGEEGRREIKKQTGNLPTILSC